MHADKEMYDRTMVKSVLTACANNVKLSQTVAS